MDFYERTSSNIAKLNRNEKVILTYVIKNIHSVSRMSIRDLAAECYVSTTTIFRFVKKLDYKGYPEFIEDLRNVEAENRAISIPSVVTGENYGDSYLKNIAEAVKVLTAERIQKFVAIMNRNPDIYIIAEGLSREVGHYFSRLLVSLGYNVYFPLESYEKEMALRNVKKGDVLLVLSYSGENPSVIADVEKVFIVATPLIISFTKADNNTIQNMSDLNFYVFSDEIEYEGADVTSRVGMITIMEILLYKKMRAE